MLISTLHFDSCSQKQEFDERYLGCGFPALVLIPYHFGWIYCF